MMVYNSSQMEISKKAVKGVFWVAITTLVAKSLRFITSLVLAKLLFPSDFGLLAMGLLAINSISLFHNLGLGQALIHYQKDIQEASETAFTMNQISAFVLSIIAILLAPYIAAFFKNPTVKPIIIILSLTIPINALATIPSFILNKQLAFRKKFLPEIISTFGYCITAIPLAYFKFGVWSIIYAQVISSIILTYSIWKVCGWRLRLKFNRTVAYELFSYGKHIVSITILVFCFQNIDLAFIGRLIDAKNLGFYSFAMMLANLPSVNISFIVAQVAFPVYSQMQKDKDQLSKTYLKTLKYVSFFVIPMCLGIFIFGPDLIHVLYADKWLSAIPPLQILVFYGLLRALIAPSGSILMAVGAVKWLSLLEVFALTAVGIFIYPVTKNYGITGVAMLITSITLCGYVIVVIKTNKYINGSLKHYLKIIVPYTVISLLCGLGAYSLTKLISPQANLALIIFSILLTAISYLLINFMYDKNTKYLFVKLKENLFSAKTLL